MTAPPTKADHFHIWLPMPSTIAYSISRYFILAELVVSGVRSRPQVSTLDRWTAGTSPPSEAAYSSISRSFRSSSAICSRSCFRNSSSVIRRPNCRYLMISISSSTRSFLWGMARNSKASLSYDDQITDLFQSETNGSAQGYAEDDTRPSLMIPLDSEVGIPTTADHSFCCGRAGPVVPSCRAGCLLRRRPARLCRPPSSPRLAGSRSSRNNPSQPALHRRAGILSQPLAPALGAPADDPVKIRNGRRRGGLSIRAVSPPSGTPQDGLSCSPALGPFCLWGTAPAGT
jgi:hypothetical protein